MPFMSWNRRMERPEVLTEGEVEECLDFIEGMKRRGLRRAMVVEQVFRLSTVMGLRAAEIAKLRIRDVHVWESDINFVRVVGGKWRKAGNALGFKRDQVEDVPVPCQSTLEAFREMRAIRLQAAAVDDVFCVGVLGKPLGASSTVWRWFRWALGALPEERQRELSTHNGRHTAITRVAARPDVSLATASDFARHRNMSETLRYLHGSELPCLEMYESRSSELNSSLDFSVERLTEELMTVIERTPSATRNRERLVINRLRARDQIAEYEELRPRLLGICMTLGLQRAGRRETVVSRWASERLLGEDLYANC